MDQQIVAEFYKIKPILERLATRYKVDLDSDHLLGWVWERRAKFDPGKGSLPVWILVVCKNHLIGEARRKRTASLDVLPGFEPAAHICEPVEPVELPNLDCLTPDERAVIVAVYLEDRKFHEAAAFLNIPLGTVSSRVGRALEKLRGAA